MADFATSRDSLAQARHAVDAAQAELAGAREGLRSLRATAVRLDRRAAGVERERLSARLREATQRLDTARTGLAEATAAAATALAGFAEFADPRIGLAQLADSAPMLLFP